MNKNYRGNRVIFDNDGEVITMTGEAEGAFPLKEITAVDFVDIPYGAIDYTKQYIAGVDLATRQPIIKPFPVQETEEQRRIRELEDALLIQTNNEVGGIL